MIIAERNKTMIDSFTETMIESIRFFSRGNIPESDIRSIAVSEVAKLDFNNEWQMHKGVGYFAKNAVKRYLAEDGMDI